MPALDPIALTAILVALLLGGVLKGATGAGSPVIAIPVMAAFFDVRLAVVIMGTSNLVSNLWQLRQFWSHRMPGGFAPAFALAGGIGACFGTWLLAVLPAEVLTLLVALAVTAYVALRLLRPDLRLALAQAKRLVWPAGLSAGVLQGAAGISAPISVSFLNAIRLERPVFIATLTMFFTVMSGFQITAMFVAGLMTSPLLALSAASLIPIFAAMPLGSWLAGKLSPAAFDRLVLGLLVVLATRLYWTALS